MRGVSKRRAENVGVRDLTLRNERCGAIRTQLQDLRGPVQEDNEGPLFKNHWGFQGGDRGSWNQLWGLAKCRLSALPPPTPTPCIKPGGTWAWPSSECGRPSGVGSFCGSSEIPLWSLTPHQPEEEEQVLCILKGGRDPGSRPNCRGYWVWWSRGRKGPYTGNVRGGGGGGAAYMPTSSGSSLAEWETPLGMQITPWACSC